MLRARLCLALFLLIPAVAYSQLELMREPPPAFGGVSSLTCSDDGSICADKNASGTSVSLIEKATGRTLRQLPVEEMFKAGPMAFSRNNSLFAYGFQSNLKVFAVWETTTGRRLYQRAASFLELQQGPIVAIAFNGDGKLVAFIRQSGAAEIWDTTQWNIVDFTGGFRPGAVRLAFADQHHLAAYYPDGSGMTWQRGSNLFSPASGTGPGVSSVAVQHGIDPNFDRSPEDFEVTADDRLLFPGTPGGIFDLRHGTITVLPPQNVGPGEIDGFDLANPEVFGAWSWTEAHLVDQRDLRPVVGRSWPTYRTMAVSRDGKLVAVKRGTKLAVIRVTDNTEKQFETGINFEKLRFSADGGALILSGEDIPMAAIASDTGKRIWLPKVVAPQDLVSDDLRYAVQMRWTGFGSYLRIVDIARRRGLLELPINGAPGSRISADGKLLAVPLKTGEIVVLEMGTWQEVATVPGFPGDIIEHIRFTSDDKRLIASGLGGLIRVWDIQSQAELLTLSIQHADWAAFTAGGAYDGTDGELKNFYWVRGLSTAALATASSDHRVTGLVSQVWSGAWKQGSGVRDAASAISPPTVPRLAIESANPGHENSAGMTVTLKMNGESAVRLAVFATRNGVPLQVSPAAGRTNTWTVQTTLQDGTNHIVAWAVDGLDRATPRVGVDRGYRLEERVQPQIVHGGAVSGGQRIAFSRDGSLMATASGHNVVIWEMQTRRQLRTIVAQSAPVTQVEFGATNNVLVSGAQDEPIHVWDTRTGLEICRVDMLSATPGLMPFAIDRQNRLAVVDPRSGIVRVFKALGCDEIESFDAGEVEPHWAGDRLVFQAPGDPAVLNVVDTEGATESQLKLPAAPVKTAVLASGRVAAIAKDGQAYVQSAAGDFQRLTAPSGETGKASDLVSMPDGGLLVDMGRTEYLYAADLVTVEKKWKDGYLQSAAASEDGRWIGFADTLDDLKVYEGPSWIRSRIDLEKGLGAVNLLAFSRDGQVLAAGRGAAAPQLMPLPGGLQLQMWDLATSSVIFSRGQLGDVVMSNINWLISSQLKTIGAVNGQFQLLPFTFATTRGRNGQLLVTKAEPDQNHPQVSAVPVPQGQIPSMMGWRISSSLNAVAVSGKAPGEVDIVDVVSGKLIAAIRAHPGLASQAALSSDGALLLTFGDGSEGNSVRLWDNDGKALWRIEGESLNPHFLAFSDDSKVAAIAADARIRLVDVVTGQVRQSIAMEPAEITAMAFAPGDVRLAVGTADGLIEIFDCATGQLLVTLAGEPSGEMAWTPDAYYSGNLTRSAALSFRLGDHVYPLQQFDLYYNRPDVVMQRIAPDLKPVIDSYKVAYERRLKDLGIRQAVPPALTDLPKLRVTLPTVTTVNSAELRLSLTAHAAANATLRAIEIQIDGVAEPLVRATGQRTFTASVPLELSNGRNNIEVTAIDSLERRSLIEEFTIDSTAKAPSTLFVAAVGVSAYEDTNQQLRFAAKDAGDLASYFRSHATPGEPGEFDKIVVLDPLTDTTATSENIRALSARLSAGGVNDTVVLIFAGHGLVDNNLDFYFAPWDMNFAQPAQRGISIQAMEQILAASHSRRRLLLIDACHSGELDKSGVIRVMPASTTNGASGGRGLGIRTDAQSVNAFELERSLFSDLRQTTGTQIIAASRGEEVAYEYGALSNGIFTRAVLDGLQNSAADENGDGHVSVSELLDFVSAKVKEITQGKQTPTQRQANLEDDFVIQ